MTRPTVDDLIQDLTPAMLRYAGGGMARKRLRRRVRTILERSGIPQTVAREFRAAAQAQIEIVDNLSGLGALPRRER